MGKIKSSAYYKWRCEYHIVFAPKFRRKEINGKLKGNIGQILRNLYKFSECDYKKIDAELATGIRLPRALAHRLSHRRSNFSYGIFYCAVLSCIAKNHKFIVK